MIKLLNWVVTFLRNTNPVVAAVFTSSTAALSVWALFQSMWTTVIARIDTLIISSSGGSVDFSPLGMVNYIFPLTELLNFIVAYAGIRLTCAAIRIIKSFVPTIA